MGYRTAGAAVSEFMEALQLAVSCVTSGVVNNRGGNFPAAIPHVAVLVNLPEGGPIPLQMRDTGVPHLALKFSHTYRVLDDATVGRGPWRVQTAAYHYDLSRQDGTGEPRELFLYHWHPGPQPGSAQTSGTLVTTPHLHVHASHVGRDETPAMNLDDFHLPTGRVALEEVLRFAIRDCGVRPLRDDWESILEKTEMAFLESRTWA
jgi:hypothetical protein